MEDYEKLNELIDRAVEKRLSSILKENNLLQRKLAQVAEVSEEIARVYFPPDYTTKSVFYKNKTGMTLDVDDWVYIYVDFGNVDQGWIIEKK